LKNLKQFIYLDEYKMYSLYSQLFEGLPEYLLKRGEVTAGEQEQQKGPIASGKLVASSASETQGQLEKRILYDYLYTLFEAELVKLNTLIEYDSDSGKEVTDKIIPGALVRVRGWADFNDMKALGDTVAGFNTFGSALAYVTTQDQRAAIQQEMEKLKAGEDRHKKTKIKRPGTTQIDLDRLAKETGHHVDEQFLACLAYLLTYGYAEHFELQILPHGKIPEKPFFSSLLKRQCLREEETFITKKFSRQAPGSFCLLGIVCQGIGENDRPVLPQADSHQHLREAIGGMVSALSDLEKDFFRRLDNEIIIDPVALYREIEIPTKKDTIVSVTNSDDDFTT
jgi:hypothetical protein